jgi:hypothetical protein
MAEFASDNHTSETTGCSPFVGNYSFYPRMTFSQHPVQNENDIREVNTNSLSQKMNEIFEQMKLKCYELKRFKRNKQTSTVLGVLPYHTYEVHHD